MNASVTARLPEFTLLFVLACAIAATPVLGQTTYTVTVAVKTESHPYFSQGDPEGYVIDGVQGAELTLERGQTYVFQMSNVSVLHPFYISTDAAGGGAGIWNDGVDGNFVSGNNALTFTVPEHAPDLLWYQCAAHIYMGWRLNIVDGQSDSFTAELSGGMEVPANASRATGTITAELSGSTLVVSGGFEGLTGTYTASHIHVGYAGQNGPVEIPLTADVAGGGQAGTYDPVANTFELDGSQLAALAERRFYVNVHSTVYPPGEIRGQLVAGAAASFHAALTGRAEIPANASQGLGGIVTELEGSTLTVTGAFSGLESNYTASHIHVGSLHESGPVVLGLTATLTGDSRGGTYSAAANTFELDAGQIAALNAGDYYVNVHSVNLPPGEIRGQLFPVGTQTFESFLLGVHETPPITSGASGGAIAHLDGMTLRLGGAFDGLESDYTASHIHVGVVGAAGGVIIPLVVELDEGSRGGVFPVASNTFELTTEQVGQLFTEALYINVHSVDHGPGEIRGQMLVATNRAPQQPTITDPADGTTIVVDGDPEKTILVAWNASDPNLNRLRYRWQIALDAGFQVIVLDEDAGLGTAIDVTYEEVDALLAALGVQPGQSITLHHRIAASDGGFVTIGAGASVTLERGTVIDTEPDGDGRVFAVAAPAPNPFTSSTTLLVDLPSASEVTVTLFDVLGRRVDEVRHGTLPAGSGHALEIAGGSLAAGTYIYRVQAIAPGGTHVASGRIVRTR